MGDPRHEVKNLQGAMQAEKKSVSGKEVKETKLSEQVRDTHLGLTAYAPPPQISEELQKTAEAKEVEDFKHLYSGKPRITIFPKSPEMVSIKLPPDIKTEEDLKAEIQKLKLPGATSAQRQRLEDLEKINRQIEQNKAFKKQFNELIDKIIAWANSEDAKGVDKAIAKTNFQKFRENIFTDAFAGNQQSDYFEELKYLLEKFYLYYLRNESIPVQVKAAKVKDLLPDLIVCAPGVHAHLQADADVLRSAYSIEKSLAGFRTQIVERLAKKYILEKKESKNAAEKVGVGNEPHVPISYMKLAKQLGLNPEWKESTDAFHVYTHLDGIKSEYKKGDFFNNPKNVNRIKFENEFKKEFTYEAITKHLMATLNAAIFDAVKVEMIDTNNAAKKENEDYDKELKKGSRSKPKVIEELKMDGQYWPLSYTKILDAVITTLKSAGLELEEDWLEYNDKQTHAKLKQDVLRHQLMTALMKKGIFNEGMIHEGKIYFYSDYIPQLSPFEYASMPMELRKEFESRLDSLPETVKDEMTIRLNDLEIKYRLLLNDHIKLKQAVEKEDENLIKELIKKPGINLYYKIYNKENLWDLAVRVSNIKACELFIGTNSITKETIIDTFQQSFRNRNQTVFGFLLQTHLIEKSIIDKLIQDALLAKNKEYCKLLFDNKLIPEYQYQSILKEEKDVQEAKTAPGLFQAKLAPADAKELDALLHHVVRGEKNEVEKILNVNPKLLMHKGRAVDYSGRTIEGTAYQMALGAEDVNTGKDKNDGMAEMIQSYFLSAYDKDEKAANKEIIDQQEAQFPGGYQQYFNSKEFEQKYKNDMKALDTVFVAIKNATVQFQNGKAGYNEDDLLVDEKCAAALNAFREYLRPKEVIKQGIHFNVGLLTVALKSLGILGDAYDSNDHHHPKRVLFWRTIIGSIEYYLPACYAQAFCQGLTIVNDVSHPLQRSLKLYDLFFYFSNVAAGQGLGSKYAVYSYYGGMTIRFCDQSCSSSFSSNLRQFWGSRDRSFEELMQHSNKRPQKRQA